MRRQTLLIALSLILLTALASLTIWLKMPRNRLITGNEFRGVIFHRKNTEIVLGVMLIKENFDYAYWMPSKAEIVNIEKQLQIHVREEMPALAQQLSTYRRQYYGFMRDGRNLVFIVGFCEPVKVDWRKELVSLPTAAGCYFEAQYDVDSAQLFYLWENTE